MPEFRCCHKRSADLGFQDFREKERLTHHQAVPQDASECIRRWPGFPSLLEVFLPVLVACKHNLPCCRSHAERGTPGAEHGSRFAQLLARTRLQRKDICRQLTASVSDFKHRAQTCALHFSVEKSLLPCKKAVKTRGPASQRQTSPSGSLSKFFCCNLHGEKPDTTSIARRGGKRQAKSRLSPRFPAIRRALSAGVTRPSA